MRAAVLLALALLPAVAVAQEVAPFEPVVREAAYIIEAPPDSVRAVVAEVWPDVLLTGARPDEAAPWTAYIRAHERGTYLHFTHLVSTLEDASESALYARLGALRDSLARSSLSARIRQLPADGDLSCLDIRLPKPQFSETKRVTAEGDTVRFAIVDSMPELLPNTVDGMAALQERAVHPEALKRQGVEGRVFVQFIVDERGVPICPEVARGVHPILDKIAVDAVSIARFRNMRVRGPSSKVKFSLPVSFCPNGLQPSSEPYNLTRCSSSPGR